MTKKILVSSAFLALLCLGPNFPGGSRAQAPPAPTPAPTPAPAPSPFDPPPGVIEKARAVITLMDGRAVPADWPLGVALVLSSSNSVAGDLPESVGWEVEPPYLTQWLGFVDGGRSLILNTGTRPKTIFVALTVAKGDTFHRVQHRISASKGPDEPDPDPQPPPGPGPNPPPPPLPPKPDGKETGKLHVTLLWDSSIFDLPSTEARTTQAVRDGVRALNSEWTTLDFQSTPGKAFIFNLKPKPTPPVVIVTRHDATLVKIWPVPAKATDIVDLVKGLRP